MSRFLAFLFLVGLLVAGGGSTVAQSGGGADLDPRLAGYPELTIRLTDEQIETPAQIVAGRTLVVQENVGHETGHAFVLRVPDDVTEAEVTAALAPGNAPLAKAEQLPTWFFRGTFMGNPDRAAVDGGRNVALVDLLPGRYLVMDPYRAPAASARFEAVADAGATAATADPVVDAVADMYEMAFRLPAEVPAGRQVWQVKNIGAAPHEIAIMPVPAGATVDQVEAAAAAALRAEAAGGTFNDQPAPAGFDASWADWRLQLVHGVGVTSPGRSVWAQFDLQPGTYAALCFVPGGDGVPHLMAGMVQTFTAAPLAS